LNPVLRIDDLFARQTGRPFRLNDIASDGRIMLFKRSGAAGKRPSGAHKIAKSIDLMIGFFKEFRSGMQIV
jgi:hypothetical protein